MESPDWGLERWDEVRKPQLVIVSVPCHSQSLMVLYCRYTALMLIKAFEEEKKNLLWVAGLGCCAVSETSLRNQGKYHVTSSFCDHN